MILQCNYNKVISNSTVLIKKINGEKYKSYYKIKILTREINNKVLAINQYKKYETTKIIIDKKSSKVKKPEPKSGVRNKKLHYKESSDNDSSNNYGDSNSSNLSNSISKVWLSSLYKVLRKVLKDKNKSYQKSVTD